MHSGNQQPIRPSLGSWVSYGLGTENANLPAYVTGLALSGDKYTSRTNVMIFSPTGGGVVGATLNGKEVEFGTGLERDRGVAVLTVDLPPGTSQTYDVTIQPGESSEGAESLHPRLWTTPGVRPWQTSVQAGPRCTTT